MTSWLKPDDLRALAERRWGPQRTWRCSFCGRSVPDGAVDHFVPRERGGTDLPWFLNPICGPCNRSKSAHDSLAWAAAVGIPDSTVSALLAITRSPDWSASAAGHRHPSPHSPRYRDADGLYDPPARLLLPRNLAEVFVLDGAAWAPVTALRRLAADYLVDAGRPPLSSQQLNRDLDSRGLVRTKRKGVYGYRGFRVVPELAAAGRFAVGAEAAAAARRQERLDRGWALASHLDG